MSTELILHTLFIVHIIIKAVSSTQIIFSYIFNFSLLSYLKNPPPLFKKNPFVEINPLKEGRVMHTKELGAPDIKTTVGNCTRTILWQNREPDEITRRDWILIIQILARDYLRFTSPSPFTLLPIRIYAWCICSTPILSITSLSYSCNSHPSLSRTFYYAIIFTSMMLNLRYTVLSKSSLNFSDVVN